MNLRRIKQVAAFVVGLVLCGAALPAAAQTVLVLGAPSTASWNTDVQTKLQATGLFTSVDVIDASATTPSLATLQTYDAVLVFSDTGFANSATLGNNLHDYILAGGGVVTAVFATASVPIGGAFQTNGDSPITPLNQNDGTLLSLGAIAQPGHPILAGVGTFDGGSSSYYGTGPIDAGATLIASWSNGAPLIATKSVGGNTVVGLNFYPPSSDARGDFWTATTDGDLILANSLLFVAGPPPATIPTMSEWAMILFGLMLAGGAAIMIQRRRLTA